MYLIYPGFDLKSCVVTDPNSTRNGMYAFFILSQNVAVLCVYFPINVLDDEFDDLHAGRYSLVWAVIPAVLWSNTSSFKRCAKHDHAFTISLCFN